MRGCTSGRKNHPLAARIKRLMQKDDEVGRIASVTPVLISRALELFLRKLCTNVIDYAKSRKSRTVLPSHLKAYVHSETTMDFLRATVKEVPDISVAENATAVSPTKRMRGTMAEESVGTRTQGKGRRDWLAGRTSKRRCVPNDGMPNLAQSVFATHRTGEVVSIKSPSGWAVSTTNSSPTFLITQSDSQQLCVADKHVRISSLPPMQAVPTNELHGDPTTWTMGLQKALQPVSTEPPSSAASSFAMPPVSVALSISDVELGVQPNEIKDTTSISVDLCTSSPFLNMMESRSIVGPPPLNAEEDNYDITDDDMEDADDPKKE